MTLLSTANQSVQAQNTIEQPSWQRERSTVELLNFIERRETIVGDLTRCGLFS